MRLCFIDFADWDFNADGPTLRPLGGSQSAMCYLSIALAKAGHAVTIMTGTTSPGMTLGVECVDLGSCNNWFMRERSFDAVTALNGGGLSKLRAILPSSTQLILWTQHETAQPAMSKLLDPAVRDKWDRIVFVSDWQRAGYLDEFRVKPERTTVLRNAIAPCFERLFNDAGDLAVAKSNPLTLAYTSTPYRGLQHLLTVFPEIKRSHPGAKLSVYSSMAVYPKHEEMDRVRFAELYDKLRAVDGVDYVGSLAQPALAEQLAVSHVLAYPCIHPETSCIAAMEAMAAGMRVVTTDLAALPETCEGFADLVPIDFQDQQKYAADYTERLAEVCSGKGVGGLWEQVVHMNKNHTWAVRARQWTEFLTSAQAVANAA